ncbi:MAG: MBL fold metallo-hydrolase [Micromonosporaceae bacterium]
MEQPPHWTEPGAHLVAPGVHRVPLPLPHDGLRAVNVYVIETGADLTLVDGGWALEASRRQLESSLRTVGYRVSDIGRFLVTHVHRDHYTQAVAIRREFGSKVSMGVGEKPGLQAFHDAARAGEPPQWDQLQFAGAEPLIAPLRDFNAEDVPDLSDWEFPDEWLTEDSMLGVPGRDITAVSTPGHTRGHMVFADLDGGLLFAGDHVLPHITPSIGFEITPSEQPLRDFLASLAKVRALPDLRLLPAHGPVTESVHARVDELVAHHDHRLAQCFDAVAAGLETGYLVAEALPWTRHERRFADLDLFNQLLATIETTAHLQLLAARGDVSRQVYDGVAYYAVPATDAADSQLPGA